MSRVLLFTLSLSSPPGGLHCIPPKDLSQDQTDGCVLSLPGQAGSCSDTQAATQMPQPPASSETSCLSMLRSCLDELHAYHPTCKRGTGKEQSKSWFLERLPRLALLTGGACNAAGAALCSCGPPGKVPYEMASAWLL